MRETPRRASSRKLAISSVALAAILSEPSAAQELQGLDSLLVEPRIAGLAGATIVLVAMGYVTYAILTSRRMQGSSLFNRLFVVVAVTSGFFRGI